MATCVNGRWVVPALTTPDPEALLVLSVSGPPASDYYGAQIDRLISEGARFIFVGQRTDLGSIPSLDKFFRPLPPGAVGQFPQALAPPQEGEAQFEVLGSTPSGEVWRLRVGEAEIVSLPVSDAFQAAEWLDLPPAQKYYAPHQMLALLYGETPPP